MKRYKDFQPTRFDVKGLALPEQQDWLVFSVVVTRDHSFHSLDVCNMDAALMEASDNLPTEDFETHNFNHWACGWFQILIVHPKHEAWLQKIEDRLEEYPILNEDMHSEREHEAICQAWDDACHRERIGYCQEAGLHWLRCRQKDIPDLVYDVLREKVHQW